MLYALRQKAWRQINHTFPERQIYIRSDGRVQFFTFDPLMQVICAGAGIVVLGWVAFTSVNVIFKDRIIATKDRHFVEMQTAYETRIADLQISYDELNGALTVAEDQFEAVAESFEAKQRAIANLIEHKQNVQASLGIVNSQTLSLAPVKAAEALPAKAAQTAPAAKPAYLGMNMGISGIIEDLIPNIAQSLMPASTSIGPLRALPPFSAVPTMMPREAAPAPAAPQRSTFLDGAVRRIGAFFGRKAPAAEIDNRSLRHIAEVEARVTRLDEANPVLLSEAKQDVDKEVTRLTRILRNVGVDPKSLVARSQDASGRGGPLLKITPAQLATPDPAFNSGVAGAIGSLAALNDVADSLRTVPLTTPLHDAAITSGFGGRSDPFTETLAYHTGIDFSGAKGTGVRVTAPGIVVFAARNGDYGNMVEVDHGNRIHTRYAHLQKINVPVGTRLEKGEVVGELGSTGRSTGPHVHYEVWYDNVVRDPQRFIKAGRDVLKEQ
jgi:murein DD-endopeptidase MepM/ murein hydrolase activator NlpD